MTQSLEGCWKFTGNIKRLLISHVSKNHSFFERLKRIFFQQQSEFTQHETEVTAVFKGNWMYDKLCMSLETLT